MSLFDAIGELCAMPIRCAGEVVKDISGNGDNEECDFMLSLLTCGASSVVKGIGKSITKAYDKLG